MIVYCINLVTKRKIYDKYHYLSVTLNRQKIYGTVLMAKSKHLFSKYVIRGFQKYLINSVELRIVCNGSWVE